MTNLKDAYFFALGFAVIVQGLCVIYIALRAKKARGLWLLLTAIFGPLSLLSFEINRQFRPQQKN
ncbi:hypothetical protein ACFL35_00535 [Candidatus Riflebacteria bacterium]